MQQRLHSVRDTGRTPAQTTAIQRAPSRSIVPRLPFEMSFVRSKSQVSELHRCSVCTRDTTTRQLVLETPQQHCPNLDQSRSHLTCCEHSWAEQTTGPRTMRLRVRIQTVEKNRAKSRSKDRHSRSEIWYTTRDSSTVQPPTH